MKVSVTGGGGSAAQGLQMKQDGLYKLTFRAKGLSNTTPAPFALVLDRNVSSRYTYDVWDTPIYEYYYGTHKMVEGSWNGAIEGQEWYLTNEWQTYTCYIDTSFGLLEGKTLEDAKAYHTKSDGTQAYDGTTMPRLPVMYWSVNGNPVGTEYLIDDVALEAVNTFPVISNVKVNGKLIPGKEVSVSYDYVSATGAKDAYTTVRVFAVENGQRTAVGSFKYDESFVVPETAIGKTLVFDVLPIDENFTCGLSVTASATEDAGAWAKLYVEDDYSVRAYSSSDATATVIFAAYNGKELVSAKAVPGVSLTANTKADIPVPADFAADGATSVKVMLWNNVTAATPLCEAVTK